MLSILLNLSHQAGNFGTNLVAMGTKIVLTWRVGLACLACQKIATMHVPLKVAVSLLKWELWKNIQIKMQYSYSLKHLLLNFLLDWVPEINHKVAHFMYLLELFICSKLHCCVWDDSHNISSISLNKTELVIIMSNLASAGLNYYCYCMCYCAVPENIHTHPMDGQWKFRGGGGSQKPKF